MKIKRLLSCTFLLLALLSASISFASDYKKINADKLKEIESNDNFLVKVINKQVKIDGAPRPAFLPDLLSLTIKNDDSLPVKDLTVYLVAYDEECSPLKVGISPADYPYIQVLKNMEYSNREYCINADDYAVFNMECNGKRIAGIRVIVASYITVDDAVHDNPLTDEWMSNVTGSRTIQLD